MLAFLLPLILAWSASAEFRVPALTGPVVDGAQVLSAQTKTTLENFIREHVAQGGAQLQVVTLASLEGLSIEEASIKIADQWKIGDRKLDRGAILVLAYADHRVRIEVGQGLEGDLTDAISSRIVRDVMIPQIRTGDVDHAVMDGVLAIAHYADPTLETADPAMQTRAKKRGAGGWPLLIFWLLIFLFFIGPGRGFAGLFLLSALGGGGRGGFGGSSGGGGWSGGGGGFSGGGSSGSW